MKKLALLFILSISYACAMEDDTNEKTNQGYRVVVEVDVEASLSGSMVLNLLVDAGTYQEGTPNYALQTGGSLTTAKPVTVNWVTQASISTLAPVGNGLIVTTSEDGKILVVKTDVPTEDNENN